VASCLTRGLEPQPCERRGSLEVAIAPSRLDLATR
jgi:hypothetical protein